MISAQAIEQFARGLREAPALAEQEMQSAVTEITLMLQSEVMERMPVGATGLTRASVTQDVFSEPAGVLGVVGSAQPAAYWLEHGRKPGPVSREGQKDIQAWVKAVLGISDEKEALGVAFLVARKIRRYGSPAQRPFAKALEDLQALIDARLQEAAANIAQALGGGEAA